MTVLNGTSPATINMNITVGEACYSVVCMHHTVTGCARELEALSIFMGITQGDLVFALWEVETEIDSYLSEMAMEAKWEADNRDCVLADEGFPSLDDYMF